MNIGFDLDKIFINYPPLIPSWIIDKLYKEKSNGILKYRIPGKIEQRIRQLSHTPFLRLPITQNVNYLKSLHLKNGNKLYLISSRFSFLKKQTEDLVKRNGFDKIFTVLSFNYEDKQPHLFKNKLIKQHNINIYVDDDLALLKYLSKNNPKTHFFWLNNTTQGKISTNLFAITKLSDMLE